MCRKAILTYFLIVQSVNMKILPNVQALYLPVQVLVSIELLGNTEHSLVNFKLQLAYFQ